MNLVRSCLACGRPAPTPCEALLGEAERVRRSLLAKPDRCVRQNRVVLAVVATVKPCGDGSGAQPGLRPSPIRKATVTKRNSSPGRARHKPSTRCAGKAECSASPVCCCAVFLRYIFAQRTAGASRHPVFPAPSPRRRGKEKQNSGALSRENADLCVI